MGSRPSPGDRDLWTQCELDVSMSYEAYRDVREALADRAGTPTVGEVAALAESGALPAESADTVMAVITRWRRRRRLEARGWI